ncbi:MAG: cytochrome c [Chloroflexota bacterium]
MKKYFRIILLLTTLAMTSCAGNSESQDAGALESVPTEYAGLTNPFTTDAASDGALIFQGYCESCHGPQGKGDGYAGQNLDPKPKDLAELQSVAGDDYLFWRVADGKPGTSMIAWRGILEDEQIWKVVAFIRTLK